MPLLIQAIEKEITPHRRSALATRGQKLKEQSAGFMKAIHQQAAMAWNASPVSTARTCAEVWNQIRSPEYTMTSEVNFLSEWPYPAVGDGQALQLHGPFGRRRRRLQLQRRARRGSGEQGARAGSRCR